MDKLLEYSMQLAMLSSLFDEKLITEREYMKIKAPLDKKYRIKSNLYG